MASELPQNFKASSSRSEPSEPFAPQIIYTAIANQEAELEYDELIRPTLLKYCLDQSFSSFSCGIIGCSNERNDTWYAVVSIAPEMNSKIAMEIKQTLRSLATQHLTHFYFFRAFSDLKNDVYRSVNRLQGFDDFQRYQELGLPIGVPKSTSSASIGLYFHFENDPNQYCLSVHRELCDVEGEMSPPSVSVGQLVMHPSPADIGRLRRHLRAIRDKYAAEDRHWDFADELLHDASFYEKGRFGTVVCSEFDCSEGARIANWTLIQLYETGQRNRIPLGDIICRHEVEFVPVDYTYYYIIGDAEPKGGDRVVKYGRSSLLTEGIMQFSKFDVMMSGAKSPTREYVVAALDRTPFSIDGDAGAPVIGKLGQYVGFIVGSTLGVPVFIPGQESLLPSSLSFVSSWHDIKNRIEAKMKAKVVLDINLRPR
jgi:hypothetical protein